MAQDRNMNQSGKAGKAFRRKSWMLFPKGRMLLKRRLFLQMKEPAALKKGQCSWAGLGERRAKSTRGGLASKNKEEKR